MLRFAWKLHPWLNRPSWIHFRDQNWNLTVLYSSKSRFKILGPIGSPACAVDFLTSLSCQNHLLSSFSRHLHFFLQKSTLVKPSQPGLKITRNCSGMTRNLLLLIYDISPLISSHDVSSFNFAPEGARWLHHWIFSNLDSSDFLINTYHYLGHLCSHI